MSRVAGLLVLLLALQLPSAAQAGCGRVKEVVDDFTGDRQMWIDARVRSETRLRFIDRDGLAAFAASPLHKSRVSTGDAPVDQTFSRADGRAVARAAACLVAAIPESSSE